MTTEQLCLTAAILFFCVALYMFFQREKWRDMAEDWEHASNGWERLCKENGDGFKRATQSLTEANATTQRALDTIEEWKRMYFDLKGHSIELPLGVATEDNPDYSKN